MPLRGPPARGTCLREAKGVLGEQSWGAGSIPQPPSTPDLSLASVAAGGKLRHGWWWWWGLPPHAAGRSPPLPSVPPSCPGLAEGSRQQPQHCPQAGTGTGRGVKDRGQGARAAGGCSLPAPLPPGGAVPLQQRALGLEQGQHPAGARVRARRWGARGCSGSGRCARSGGTRAGAEAEGSLLQRELSVALSWEKSVPAGPPAAGHGIRVACEHLPESPPLHTSVPVYLLPRHPESTGRYSTEPSGVVLVQAEAPAR